MESIRQVGLSGGNYVGILAFAKKCKLKSIIQYNDAIRGHRSLLVDSLWVAEDGYSFLLNSECLKKCKQCRQEMFASWLWMMQEKIAELEEHGVQKS